MRHINRTREEAFGALFQKFLGSVILLGESEVFISKIYNIQIDFKHYFKTDVESALLTSFLFVSPINTEIIYNCGGLVKNGPHRLLCLDAWSKDKYKGVELLEEVCHW